MKILGIGNAIVDVICKVDDQFISQNNLTKSTMKLVDEIEFKKLLSNLKIVVYVFLHRTNPTKTSPLYLNFELLFQKLF